MGKTRLPRAASISRNKLLLVVLKLTLVTDDKPEILVISGQKPHSFKIPRQLIACDVPRDRRSQPVVSFALHPHKGFLTLDQAVSVGRAFKLQLSAVLAKPSEGGRDSRSSAVVVLSCGPHLGICHISWRASSSSLFIAYFATTPPTPTSPACTIPARACPSRVRSRSACTRRRARRCRSRCKY